MSLVSVLMVDQSVAQFIGITSQWQLLMELHGVVHGAFWTQAHSPAFSLYSPDITCPCTELPLQLFPRHFTLWPEISTAEGSAPNI